MTFLPLDAPTLLRQIGVMDLMSISGLRSTLSADGTRLILPVGNGYRVEILLDASDTYTVRRVFARGAKTWIKGEQTNVYAEEVGQVAYEASCFRSYDFPKVSTA